MILWSAVKSDLYLIFRSYGILYMIYNPAIQAKVQEELDEVKVLTV